LLRVFRFGFPRVTSTNWHTNSLSRLLFVEHELLQVDGEGLGAFFECALIALHSCSGIAGRSIPAVVASCGGDRHAEDLETAIAPCCILADGTVRTAVSNEGVVLLVGEFTGVKYS
jgi:hypothetical protein